MLSFGLHLCLTAKMKQISFAEIWLNWNLRLFLNTQKLKTLRKLNLKRRNVDISEDRCCHEQKCFFFSGWVYYFYYLRVFCRVKNKIARKKPFFKIFHFVVAIYYFACCHFDRHLPSYKKQNTFSARKFQFRLNYTELDKQALREDREMPLVDAGKLLDKIQSALTFLS